jgi:DNA-binding transcriptional LysR family regulator
MKLETPPWDVLEAFLAVMRTGSLSGAARALNLAQPTVRRHIEALEAHWGAVLFTRMATGLTPTDAAREALPLAEDMDASARALARAVSGPKQAVAGRVRITCSLVLAREVLPEIVRALQKKHPAIDIELSATNAVEDLRRRDADIAIRFMTPTQSSLTARKLGAIRIGLYGAKAYLRAHGTPVKLTDLYTDHRLIGPDRQQAMAQGLAGAGLDATKLRFAIRTDDDVAQLAMVRAGVGLGVCQIPLAVKDASLIRVLPILEFSLETWLVMHEDLRTSPRIRAVFDHLAAELTNYMAASKR